MLLIFGLVRCIAKPSLIKVSRVSLHCSDMLNSKFSKNFAKSLFPDMGVYCGSSALRCSAAWYPSVVLLLFSRKLDSCSLIRPLIGRLEAPMYRKFGFTVYLVPCFTLFAVISGDVKSKMKAKFVNNRNNLQHYCYIHDFL